MKGAPGGGSLGRPFHFQLALPPSTNKNDTFEDRLTAVEDRLTSVLVAVEALPERLNGSEVPRAGYADLYERALTTAGACHALAVGRTKLYELIAEGHLRPVKLGRELRFPVVQIRALLQRGTQPAQTNR